MAEKPSYPEEFKKAAVVRLATEKRVDVAKDLQIDPSTIGKWRVKYGESLGLPPMRIRETAKEKKLPAKKANKKKRERRAFTEEFKIAVVKQVQAGETAVAVARANNIGATLLGRWIKQYPSQEAKRPYAKKTQHDKTVARSIALLRGVLRQIDVDDPVHLVAALVLKTLEGDM